MVNELIEYIYTNQTPENLLVDCLPFFLKLYPNEGSHKLKNVSHRLEELKKANIISIAGELYRSLGQDVAPYPNNGRPLIKENEVLLTFEEIKARMEYPEYPGSLKMQLTVQGVSEAEKKAMQKQLFETNTSIQVLNGKTGDFYSNQKLYNIIQIFLTIALLISSGLYTYFSILNYNLAKSQSQKEQDLQKLEKRLHTKEVEDAIFENAVKDSLGMPK